MADIFGTPGDDILNGTPLDDVITTHEGDDTVSAGDGDDVIVMQSNSTGSVFGGNGYDILRITSDVNIVPYWSFNVNQSELTSINTTAGSISIADTERLEVIDTGTGNFFTYVESGTAGADNINISSVVMSTYQHAVILAGDGNDTLVGSLNSSTDFHVGDGDDVATGGNENDRFFGSQGADTYDGGGNTGISGDVVYFFASSSAISVNLETGVGSLGDAAGDIYINIEDVQGTNFDDTIIGNSSNNRLTSNGGNDILDGGAGDDILTFNTLGYTTMTGGDGADLFYTNSVYSISSEITDFDANDTIEFRASGNANGLVVPTLIGTAAFSNTIGEVRYEKINGETLIHIDITGDGTADETLTISNGEFDLAASSSTSQSLNLVMVNLITGTVGNDALTGTASNDTINGLEGNDAITTLAGNDTVDAGDGDDIVIIEDYTTGTIDGGTGSDTVSIVTDAYVYFGFNSGSGNASLTTAYLQGGNIQLADIERAEARSTVDGSIRALSTTGSDGDDVIIISGETYATNGASIDLRGGLGNDTIEMLDNQYLSIRSGDGDDTLIAANSGSYLEGGNGGDIITGGTGTDTASYFRSTVGVNVNLETGAVSGGEAAGDVLTSIENLYGSFTGNNTLTGSSGDNRLESYSGDDVIDGGAGSDFIIGGQGNNVLSGGLGTDTFWFNQTFSDGISQITDLQEVDNISISQLYNNGSYVTPDFIGTSAFSGNAMELRYEKVGGQTLIQLDDDGDGISDGGITVTNGEFNLSAVSSNGLQLIIDTTIYGTSGNDDLYGTFDDDVIDGLAGDDTFYLSGGVDVFNGNDGIDTVDYGSAETSIIASLATGLGTGGEAAGHSYVSIENLRGSDGSDVLTGDENANILYGEFGNDYLRGGTGNDIIEGGFGADYLRGGAGADDIRGGAGQDWTDYSTSPLAVTIDLGAGTASGGDADGDVFSLIERVLGSTHDDMITGDGGINYLRGWSGDDTLIGGAGNDYLQGDLGADTLDGGAGINDWAYYASSTSGLTVNMGDTSLNTGEAVGDTYINIENLTGSRYSDHLTGDSSNNQIRGFLGDDMLFGGDGRDFLRGDEGADVHDGGNGLDWAYYVANSTAVTVDLGANTASGGQATGDTFFNVERVFGSRYDDSITGDSGANYLRGYLGNDILIGGDGNDFLQGDAGADTMDGGGGLDWAYYASSQNGLSINLGDANQNTGEASGDSYISIENVFGTKFDDIITGDSGDNYLRGFTGDDIINGGAGNDILRGEAGSDTFVFGFGTGSDTVTDFNDAEDWLDFSAFSGGGEINPADYAVEIDGDVVITIGTDVITIENTTILEISDNVIL